MEKVIQAILFVLHEGGTWRGINQPDANWNSVWQYYRRWCRAGVWAAVWEQVVPAAQAGAIYLDSTFLKVQRSGLNAAGGRAFQAIGLTKGGWNTKLPAAADGQGRPWALLLTGGNVAEVSQATEVLQELAPKLVVADKGSDSDPLRLWRRERGVQSCIPAKSNRQTPRPIRRSSYRKRHLIENFFGHRKTFRRVATRSDKLAETFFGWVLLAVIVKFGK